MAIVDWKYFKFAVTAWFEMFANVQMSMFIMFYLFFMDCDSTSQILGLVEIKTFAFCTQDRVDNLSWFAAYWWFNFPYFSVIKCNGFPRVYMFTCPTSLLVTFCYCWCCIFSWENFALVRYCFKFLGCFFIINLVPSIMFFIFLELF